MKTLSLFLSHKSTHFSAMKGAGAWKRNKVTEPAPSEPKPVPVVVFPKPK